MRMNACSAFRSQTAAVDAGCGDLDWTSVRPQRTGGSESCYSSTRQRVEASRAEAAAISDY